MNERPNIIELPEDEVELVRERLGSVVQLEQQLGRIRSTFLLQETNLMNRLLEASKEYQDLQAMLLKKHRKDPGQFQIVPEIGAFVSVPAQGNIPRDVQVPSIVGAQVR